MKLVLFRNFDRYAAEVSKVVLTNGAPLLNAGQRGSEL